MKSLMTAPRRSLAVGVAGVLVAGAASVVAAAPAQAAPTTDLRWNVSEQFVRHLYYSYFGGPVGAPTGTVSNGATHDAGDAAALTDDAFVFAAVKTVTGADGSSVSSFTGTVGGKFVVNGATQYAVTISDPVVIKDADGTSALYASVSSEVPPAVATTPKLVKMSEFASATTADGVTTAIPAWEGVLPPNSAAAKALEIPENQPVDGKAFAPEFLGALDTTVRGHFYATGATSDPRKNPGVVAYAAASPTAAPTTTPTVTAANRTDGLTVKVSGTNFTSVTLPGDGGVYVALAPADSKIDFANRASLSTLAAVDYITPGRIQAGAFTSNLVAPYAKLAQGKEYAVFTWQAHTHSNSTQDTKTPVTIDWTKFAEPAPITKIDSASKVKITKKPTRKKAGKAVIIVRGGAVAASGKVTVKIKRAGVKKAKKVTATLNAKGIAKVKLPKAKRKGAYKVVVTYAGDANLNAAKKTVKKFKIKK